MSVTTWLVLQDLAFIPAILFAYLIAIAWLANLTQPTPSVVRWATAEDDRQFAADRRKQRRK